MASFTKSKRHLGGHLNAGQGPRGQLVYNMRPEKDQHYTIDYIKFRQKEYVLHFKWIIFGLI